MKNLREIIKSIIEESFIEKQILFEGATDILYHFTEIGYLINILKTNTISLTSAVGSQADLDVNRGKFFFLSMTRSKSSGYKRGNAKIVFNGKKLTNNYKIIPVDYWQWSKKREDWESESAYLQSLKSSEQEDRLISNNAEIPNALSYFLELHIFVDYKFNNYSYNTFKYLSSICENNNIPIFYYSNQKDWLLQNKKNTISLNELKQNLTKSNDSEINVFGTDKKFDYDVASLVAYNSPDKYKMIIDYLQDEDRINKFKSVLEKRTNDNYKFGAFYFDDGLHYLRSSVHAIRSRADKDSRFLLKLLADDMNKFKTKNLKDYIEKKRMVGRKSLDDIKKEYYNFLINIINKSYSEFLPEYLNKYIEIGGEYYDKSYESPEVIGFVNQYINKIKSYIKDKIFDEKNDIFKYNYVLDWKEIERNIDLNGLNILDKVEINDSYYRDIEDFNIDLKNFIQRILFEMNDVYSEKAKQLYQEFIK